MEEREISIVDLMAEILLHWRMFIVWMIVGVVLLGAYSYMRSDNVAKQQQTQTEEMAQEPEDWLTDEEIRNVNYVAAYEAMYLAKEDYLGKSVLMSMDADHASKAEATIIVEADERQKSCDIKKVYEDIVLSGELVAKVAGDSGLETTDVNEMILLDQRMSNAGFYEESSSFRVIVVYGDEAECKDMLESIITFLRAKQPDIENTLGEHEITVVNRSFGVVANKKLAETKMKVLTDIADMKKTVADAKYALSDREKRYYDLLMSEVEEMEEAVLPAEPSSPHISKKYVLLGAIMAAFVYAFILLLVYIFNTKIRATDSMQELYGLPQLGMIPAAAGKKKVLGVVDKWILSIRDHNKRQFSPEEALELAAVAAKMAVGKESLQEACLMGCGLRERSLEICGKIKERLEKEGIHTAVLNNVLYDAQMLGELEGAKGVILVESAGSTLYTEIAEELELLKRQGIKALGGILVE